MAGIRSIGVSVGGQSIGKLLVAPSEQKPPKWLSFFEGALEGNLPNEFWNANTRAGLLVERSHRLFAVTFGLGWTEGDRQRHRSQQHSKYRPEDVRRPVDAYPLERKSGGVPR